jgi:Protein of unknown function (DUF4239)
MISWLESLSTLADGIVIVGGFVIVSLVFGYLVATFTPHEVRAAHNDLAGFILAVIGVVYAVLLAFVAIGLWERFERAQARAYEEAGALSTVYRDSESFPPGGQLRSGLRGYVDSVIHSEWPRMRSGEPLPIADSLLEQIDRQVRSLPVTSARLQDIHQQMLAAIDTALADRDARLTVDSRGINGLMWFVLIAGAFVTVGFACLFGFQRTLMQQLMVGSLSLLIGLVLFLAIALDYPYRGSISVQPEAFRAALANFSLVGP